MNFSALAERQEKIITEAERNYFQRYIDGINAFITERGDEYPLVFNLT